MSYPEIIINGENFKLIPPGYCACGCGRKTTVPLYDGHGGIKGRPRRYILGHHSKGRTGESNSGWKGGIINGSQGYKKAYCPGHPRATSQGYVAEHILIAERAFGKPLPKWAMVHHSNENRSENHNSNLVICQDNAYHRLIHRRKRAYDACGNANWRKCTYCKKYDDPKNMVIYGGETHSACHRGCREKMPR